MNVTTDHCTHHRGAQKTKFLKMRTRRIEVLFSYITLAVHYGHNRDTKFRGDCEEGKAIVAES